MTNANDLCARVIFVEIIFFMHPGNILTKKKEVL